jgi:Domain of unknown function (DUF4234)
VHPPVAVDKPLAHSVSLEASRPGSVPTPARESSYPGHVSTSDLPPPPEPGPADQPAGQGATPPPPPASAPPPGQPGQAPPAPPAGWYQPARTAPGQLSAPFYSPWVVILLSIVTCGIWTAIWTYRTNEDLKKYNGDGLGGVLGVVIWLVLSVVLMFTIPHETEAMYRRDGRASPVSAIWGLWFLLPLIGNIIWYVKVQRALNDFWLSKGAQPD